jgi:hypothetical protein
VQPLHDSTCDVKEYISLCRTLWSTYVEPLRSTKIGKTLETISKANSEKIDHSTLQGEILSLLGRKFLPHLGGAIEKGGLTLTANDRFIDRVHDFPMLTKYLLLAAYLCQVNRPDRDRHLFSIQKNGRRRRGNDQENAGESIAFGSNTLDQQGMSIRPRSFPTERMLSVFISMVGLHASSQMGNSNWESSIRSLGSCAFFENLACLKACGLLNDHPSRSVHDPVKMSDSSLWCSLTLDEARRIAKSIDFPLDRYVL